MFKLFRFFSRIFRFSKVKKEPGLDERMNELLNESLMKNKKRLRFFYALRCLRYILTFIGFPVVIKIVFSDSNAGKIFFKFV